VTRHDPNTAARVISYRLIEGCEGNGHSLAESIDERRWVGWLS
jgi:hypothetical protein